jgi:hypothetical protein
MEPGFCLRHRPECTNPRGGSVCVRLGHAGHSEGNIAGHDHSTFERANTLPNALQERDDFLDERGGRGVAKLRVVAQQVDARTNCGVSEKLVDCSPDLFGSKSTRKLDADDRTV